MLFNKYNKYYLNFLKIIPFLANIVGEAYNTEDKQDIVAITYGVASDGGHNLPDLTVFRFFYIQKLITILELQTPTNGRKIT